MIFKNKFSQTKYILDEEILSDIKLKAFFKTHFNKFENSAGDIEKFINYIKYDQNIDNNIITLSKIKRESKPFN